MLVIIETDINADLIEKIFILRLKMFRKTQGEFAQPSEYGITTYPKLFSEETICRRDFATLDDVCDNPVVFSYFRLNKSKIPLSLSIFLKVKANIIWTTIFRLTLDVFLNQHGALFQNLPQYRLNSILP